MSPFFVKCRTEEGAALLLVILFEVLGKPSIYHLSIYLSIHLLSAGMTVTAHSQLQNCMHSQLDKLRSHSLEVIGAICAILPPSSTLWMNASYSSSEFAHGSPTGMYASLHPSPTTPLDTIASTSAVENPRMWRRTCRESAPYLKGGGERKQVH